MNLFKIIFLCSLISPTISHYGFDSINPISVKNFTCFRENHGYEFYIGRVYKSIGELDSTVIENIKNARKAGFQFVDGYIFPCLLVPCISIKQQIEETLKWIKEQGGQIGRLWISVQGAELYWTDEKPLNQAIIFEAVKQTEAMGFKVGIYTNSTHWNQIVGNDWNVVAEKPLWLDNWSGNGSFENFVPFGGWKIPTMQQFDVERGTDCGVVINRNWYP
uniref:Lysozyme n=1 Tax=Panagrolaimus davidi TaxID=227884 RepID=A0A914P8P7_9BILA